MQIRNLRPFDVYLPYAGLINKKGWKLRARAASQGTGRGSASAGLPRAGCPGALQLGPTGNDAPPMIAGGGWVMAHYPPATSRTGSTAFGREVGDLVTILDRVRQRVT